MNGEYSRDECEALANMVRGSDELSLLREQYERSLKHNENIRCERDGWEKTAGELHALALSYESAIRELKALNAELLAALKQCRGLARPREQAIRDAAIAKAEKEGK